MSSTAGSQAAAVSEFEFPSLEEPGAAKEIFASVVLGTNAEDDEEVEAAGLLVTCLECLQQVDKDDCQSTGNSARKTGKTSGMWKCNKCNALRGRMLRLIGKNADLAADWQLLSCEQKQDFMRRSASLAKEELVHGMTSAISMSKSSKTTLAHQFAGDFLPISVYINKGFEDKHLKAMQQHAPKKWSPTLNDWVYQAMIETSSSKDEEITSNVAMYSTGSASAQQPSTSSKRGSENLSGVAEKKAKMEAEQQKKKDESAAKLTAKKAEMLEKAQKDKARKADLVAAKKVVSMMSALVAQAPLLRTRSNAAADKLPSFILKDFEEAKMKVETANTVWSDVLLNSQPAPIMASMQVDQLNDVRKSSEKTFHSLTSMLNLVEQKA